MDSIELDVAYLHELLPKAPIEDLNAITAVLKKNFIFTLSDLALFPIEEWDATLKFELPPVFKKRLQERIAFHSIGFASALQANVHYC